jgi:uncharacterized phiE125 gp8 family phage protein
MGLTLITPPDGEPVVATEAIDHLRLEADTEEDALIASLVTSAREIIETQTGRALITQTWELTLDRFPCGTVGYGASWVRTTQIQLPKPPIQSVTSVKYIDTDGVLQTLASTEYTVDTTSMRGRIVPAWGKVWPSTRDVINAVTDPVRRRLRRRGEGTGKPQERDEADARWRVREPGIDHHRDHRGG